MTVDKPLPVLSDINRPFYEASLRGELRLQRCQSCGRWIYFPRVACPHCLSERLEWEVASGKGVVYSFGIVYRPHHPSFDREVPIILAAVQVEEGPIVISEIVNCDPFVIAIGMPVQVVWEQRSKEISVARFAPVVTRNAAPDAGSFAPRA